MTNHIDQSLCHPRSNEPQARTLSYRAAAGGFGAIQSVMSEAWRQTGLVRAMSILRQINQPGGFDCSSCAWPDPSVDERTPFEFCENGAKAALWENTRQRVSSDALSQLPVSQMRQLSDYELESMGRLVTPLVYDGKTDTYKPVKWDTAFAEIGAHLKSLVDPDGAIFYTSGRTSNEAAFLYQLMIRQYGTNNLPDCSNMCHESSGAGLGSTIGIGKGTVSLEDFDEADAIIVMGQNPGTNHPRMLTTLEQAAKRGAEIISINPLLERGLERFGHPQNPLAVLGQSQSISTHYLQVKTNGDIAVLQGIAKLLLEWDSTQSCVDHEFIAEHTMGFEAYAAQVETTKWADIERSSGLSREDIETVAKVYARSNRTIICWAMGLTQHKNGVNNITEVVNLLLLRGNLGRPGAGACPVRGHSNVQGDRTMGIHEKPNPKLLESLAKRYQFEPPTAHGHDTVSAIEAMVDGTADFFMSMGGNFVAAAPDTGRVAQGMSNCNMTVHVSTKLNRTHTYPGQRSYILPCLVRSELDESDHGVQFVSCENSMSIVSSSQGHRPPAGPDLLSEPNIICHLARQTLPNSDATPWSRWSSDYDLIRNEIEAVVEGFEDYNHRVRQPGGFLLPNSAANRQWRTESGRAHFSCNEIPVWRLEPGQLLLGTLRSHDQFNTTIYGQDDRYRGIFGGRRILMISDTDLEALDLTDGQHVDITSHFSDGDRHVYNFRLVKTELPKACVMAYFPETNPLIPLRSFADGSRTPTSKSVIVTIKPTQKDA
jgi:molybdopterin-dependent oxidoreductase alpha subunit